MDKVKNVPELRFEGFTDDWKQRTLKTLLFLRNDFAQSTNFKIDVELENIEPETGNLIGDLSVRTQTKSIFRKNDILFGRLRPYLKKWHLSEQEGLKSGEIWAFYTDKNDSTKFCYSIVQSEKFLKMCNMSTGTKMPRADWNLVSKTEIFVPSLSEQERIGEFFSVLDKTITFHQREWEKYKNLKISYLEKMFPRENQNEPELRFSGFPDAWVQRKLGELLFLLKDGTHGTHKDVKNGVYLLSAKNIKNGKVLIDETDRKISLKEYE